MNANMRARPDRRGYEKILYRQHIDLVYNMALHYVRNVEEAEEITQDVFVKVYFNLSKYRFEADLKTPRSNSDHILK